MDNISNIKRIINTFGSFGISDVEAESSPVIESIGSNLHQLAERFYPDGVDAVTYVNETEISDEFIEYEQLDDDVIDEINTIAENYEADCLRTEKRIAN